MPFCAWCGKQVAEVSYAACPSCGNPTNGAPRPPAASGTNAPAMIAVVIALVLVGVAFIGILAAIAIPNLLTAMQRSKQKRTMADIRVIATAVEGYGTDNNRYPPPDALEQALVPKYVQTLPKTDGWGEEFVYECWNSSEGDVCDTYAIASSGKDRVLDFDSPDQYIGRGATTSFDDDIVMINGSFVQYPQGMQVN